MIYLFAVVTGLALGLAFSLYKRSLMESREQAAVLARLNTIYQNVIRASKQRTIERTRRVADRRKVVRENVCTSKP